MGFDNYGGKRIAAHIYPSPGGLAGSPGSSYSGSSEGRTPGRSVETARSFWRSGPCESTEQRAGPRHRPGTPKRDFAPEVEQLPGVELGHRLLDSEAFLRQSYRSHHMTWLSEIFQLPSSTRVD